jgi:hypothetical protein
MVATGTTEERYTQLICEKQGYCLCAGAPNAWDECCCIAPAEVVRGEIDVVSSECRHCHEPMMRIDFETGERIQ